MPASAARFAVGAEKRSTLELALDHLIEHRPRCSRARRALAIALPPGSPFGAIAVDKDKCTLVPGLRQRLPGQRAAGQPERAATALHREELRAVRPVRHHLPGRRDHAACRACCSRRERKQPRVLNEAKPWSCIRCGKPFGTLKAIEAMLGKLAGHAMFQGEALERLKMCGDCRVIDLYSAQNEMKITDL